MVNIKQDTKTHILDGAEEMGVAINLSQVEMMAEYASQLMIWNKKINLTAIKEPLQVAQKHFLDSIPACKTITDGHKVMDMGSGGGFPGIVMKIMNPNLDIVLIDSVRKKVSFLKHIIRSLGLKNIDAVHTRVEDLHTDQTFIGQFDIVISRAFADLSKFTDLAAPFLNKTGSIVAMKGKQGKHEISPRIESDYSIQTREYELPLEQAHRIILCLTPK